MKRIHLAKDIQPLSDFRANTATFLAQIKETKRPIVLTQHGKSSAVLIDINEYEKLLEQIDLFNDIYLSEQQIERKEFSTQKVTKERILGTLKNENNMD